VDSLSRLHVALSILVADKLMWMKPSRLGRS
jgi:hypothetical protein